MLLPRVDSRTVRVRMDRLPDPRPDFRDEIIVRLSESCRVPEPEHASWPFSTEADFRRLEQALETRARQRGLVAANVKFCEIVLLHIRGRFKHGPKELSYMLSRVLDSRGRMVVAWFNDYLRDQLGVQMSEPTLTKNLRTIRHLIEQLDGTDGDDGHPRGSGPRPRPRRLADTISERAKEVQPMANNERLRDELTCALAGFLRALDSDLEGKDRSCTASRERLFPRPSWDVPLVDGQHRFPVMGVEFWAFMEALAERRSERISPHEAEELVTAFAADDVFDDMLLEHDRFSPIGYVSSCAWNVDELNVVGGSEMRLSVYACLLAGFACSECSQVVVLDWSPSMVVCDGVLSSTTMGGFTGVRGHEWGTLGTGGYYGWGNAAPFSAVPAVEFAADVHTYNTGDAHSLTLADFITGEVNAIPDAGGQQPDNGFPLGSDEVVFVRSAGTGQHGVSCNYVENLETVLLRPLN